MVEKKNSWRVGVLNEVFNLFSIEVAYCFLQPVYNIEGF